MSFFFWHIFDIKKTLVLKTGNINIEVFMSAFTFSQYQEQAAKTARYPDVGNNLVYPTLGLTGEAGEVADKVKKIFRDKGGVIYRRYH